MRLAITTHLWFPRLRAMIGYWFDFRVDLTGLALNDDDLATDLNNGRD